jgi:hypothetical protein
MQTASARRPAIIRPAAAATLLGFITVATLVAACEGPERAAAPPSEPRLTAAQGTRSTLLGRATFAEPSKRTFKVKRITGNWHVEVKAKPALDIAVQTITFDPGGQSGWHTHPGPVFIQVTSGTMTFYESDDPDCTPIVRTAGQGFLDTGDHAHIARNESGEAATNVVTYLAPPGAPLRSDAPAPGNCPF